MRTVKAILIDPFACTLTEIEDDADRYEGSVWQERAGTAGA
jgi:hypothetical protein